ncbi:A24 family peptidase [Microbacterium sp. MYb62]|uniref:prepilin peptidase n=1 Tax=Microbacterium sp. MYb62 TaxID=1848690 RepID=UPI000CFDDEAF|nr:A24 family peptidase [Microbacterium sp. MYb62]PRB11086.1 prepilin peptidase [Microbacterium sp. MYb62]
MDMRLALIALVHVALVGVGAWLIVIDARTHRLPNRIVLPTLGSLLVLIGIDALAAGQTAASIRALLGMVILGGFYAMLRAISRAGMGGGDVKLAAVIGLVLGWHGWQALAIGAASAFVLGAMYALVLIVLRRADGSTRVAFGPWMIAGALIGVVLG